MLGDIGQKPFSMPVVTPGPAAETQHQLPNKKLRAKASLASLYLATKQSQPLQVPPHAVMTPLQGPSNHFYSHLMRAHQVDAHLLAAQVPDRYNPERFHTQYFILGDTIEASDAAVLRGMRTIDREVAQIYVTKEVPVPKDFRSELFGTGHQVQFTGMYPLELAGLASQVNVQAAIQHPLMPHFQLITHDKLYLVMPQMGANVTDVLQNLAVDAQRTSGASHEAQVRLGMTYTMMEGVLDWLQKLHATQVAHGDIKPQNIMLRQDGHAYLIDFDAARPAFAPPAHSQASHGGAGPSAQGPSDAAPQAFGTAAYFAPEAALNIDKRDRRQGDIWSLGVSLMVTLTGQNPCEPASAAWRSGWQAATDVFKKTGAPPEPSASVPAHIAHIFADLKNAAPKLHHKIVQMLDPNPELRPTAQALGAWLQEAAQVQDIASCAGPLLHELRLQSVLGLMPVDRIVAQDARLMRPSPGERAALRPALRRANSEGNLLRPFVTPFDKSPKSLAQAAFEQQEWAASPRFFTAQNLLYAEEDALFEHLSDHPEAAARIFALDP